jgi:hypothetical protein
MMRVLERSELENRLAAPEEAVRVRHPTTVYQFDEPLEETNK